MRRSHTETILVSGLVTGLAGLALVLALAPLGRTFDALRQIWPVWAIAAPLATLVVLRSRHRWAPIIAALATLAILAPGIGETVRSWRGLAPVADAEPAGPIEISIATHNMWGRSASPEAAVEILPPLALDILALQEAFGRARESSNALASLYPYAAHCRSTRLLTRFEILEAGCIAPPDNIDWQTAIPCDWEVPPAVWARVRLPDGSETTLVSAHLTWPFPGPTQDCQRANLGRALSRLPQERMIVMGDFNAAAPSFALKRLERDLGLERRSIGIATFPSEGRFEAAGWGTPPLPPMLVGIDHIFAGEDWETVSIGTGPNTGSDHRPLVARLRLRD